jgi:hypothetical protein
VTTATPPLISERSSTMAAVFHEGDVTDSDRFHYIPVSNSVAPLGSDT